MLLNLFVSPIWIRKYNKLRAQKSVKNSNYENKNVNTKNGAKINRKKLNYIKYMKIWSYEK